MNIFIQKKMNQIDIQFYGELTARNCHTLQATLDDVLGEQSCLKVVLNLEQLLLIDTSGIGAIVYLFKRLRDKDRALNVINVLGQPRQIFELMHIANIIDVSFAAPSETLYASSQARA